MGRWKNYQCTLLHACSLVGGENALANRLRASRRQVLDWLLGKEPIPAYVYIAAIDLMIGSKIPKIDDVRAYLDGLRDRHGG